jgi:hypothetical protein
MAATVNGIRVLLQQRVANINAEVNRNGSVAYRDEITRARARGKREAYEDVLALLALLES